MPLNWNEIKDRALAFSRKWEDEESEDAEAKSFWDDFFNAYGISRSRGRAFTLKPFECRFKRTNGQTN